MRVLLGVVLAVLVVRLSTRAGDERPATIVGTVRTLAAGMTAEVMLHRLGGTPIMGRLFYAVSGGQLILCSHEAYIRAFLDPIAAPETHAPLRTDSTFDSAKAFSFVDRSTAPHVVRGWEGGR